MEQAFYQKQDFLKVYALISEDKFVYVGKTKDPKLSTVFSRHICGRCAATRDYFGKQDPIRPKMYLLERIQATEAEGYKHLLAFAAVFFRAGYVVLNHQGTRAQLLDLHPETLQLVNNISSTPLDVILKRTYLPKPTAADEIRMSTPSVVKHREDASTERICVRLTEDEKSAFEAFAASMHMTQRDAILYLLYKATAAEKDSDEWKMDQYVSRGMKCYQEKVERLEEENKQLLHKLEGQGNATLPNAQSQKIAFIREGMAKYFQHFISTAEEGDWLCTGNYRRFVQSLPKEINYEYPSTEGFMLFYPQYILWGASETPGLFYIGANREWPIY